MEDPRQGPPSKEASPRIPTFPCSTQENLATQDPHRLTVIYYEQKLKEIKEDKSLPIHDRLFQLHYLKQEYLQTLALIEQKIREGKELEACTFQPNSSRR